MYVMFCRAFFSEENVQKNYKVDCNIQRDNMAKYKKVWFKV